MKKIRAFARIFCPYLRQSFFLIFRCPRKTRGTEPAHQTQHAADRFDLLRQCLCLRKREAVHRDLRECEWLPFIAYSSFFATLR